MFRFTGAVLYGGSRAACVCPSGQFFFAPESEHKRASQTSYSDTCMLCPLGTYSRTARASACTNCTGSQSQRYTANVGSTDPANCKKNPAISVAENDAEKDRLEFTFVGVVGSLSLAVICAFVLVLYKRRAASAEAAYKQLPLENPEREIVFLRNFRPPAGSFAL